MLINYLRFKHDFQAHFKIPIKSFLFISCCLIYVHYEKYFLFLEIQLQYSNRDIILLDIRSELAGNEFFILIN